MVLLEAVFVATLLKDVLVASLLKVAPDALIIKVAPTAQLHLASLASTLAVFLPASPSVPLAVESVA